MAFSGNLLGAGASKRSRDGTQVRHWLSRFGLAAGLFTRSAAEPRSGSVAVLPDGASGRPLFGCGPLSRSSEEMLQQELNELLDRLSSLRSAGKIWWSWHA